MAQIDVICPHPGCKGMVDHVQVKFNGATCEWMLTHYIPGGEDHIHTFSWPALEQVEPDAKT